VERQIQPSSDPRAAKLDLAVGLDCSGRARKD
jgi:hypothetical protein